MMRNIPLLLFIFILAESCNSLYVPATPAVPVFEKKQALKMGGSIGIKGWNVNADYTPVNHFYFGASYHGMRQFAGNNLHESVGAHIGGYFNQGFGGHTNFQAGYTLGHSYYADPFSGSENYLRIGENYYDQLYFQAFQSVKTLKENAWIFGLRVDMYHGHYSHIWPGVYKDELPVHTAFPMGFFCYQHSSKNIPGLQTDLLFGYQVSTIEPGQYASYSFYSGLILRVGISYRVEFGKNKTEAPKNN
jgi:hypothetical protein